MKVVAAICTHYHFDHTGGKPPSPFDQMGVVVDGAATLAARGLPVHVHERDAEKVIAMACVPAASVVRGKHGSTLAVGAQTLVLLHTPGHTPGSQCVHVPAAAVLLTGDTLFIGSCGRLDSPDSNKAEMHASLQALAALPGHTKASYADLLD